MAFFAKQKLLYYKRFKMDIWSIFINTLQWKIDKTNYYCKRLERSLYYFKNRQDPLTINYKWKKRNLYLESGNNWKVFIKAQKLFLVKKSRRKVILRFILKLRVFKLKISNNWIRFFSFFIKRRLKFKKFYFKMPFIYEWKNIYLKYKTYKTKNYFLSLRITRLFYIIYTYRQLKQKANKAKHMDGLFENNYMVLIECKIPSFIYRTSFVSNMFESLIVVKTNVIWVNKIFISYLHYTIKPMDLIGFRILYKNYIYWQFYKRLKRKAFSFLFSKYIYVSLCFLIIIMLRLPLKKEIFNNASIDMYRVANYTL
jgi:ribosomal protein S4